MDNIPDLLSIHETSAKVAVARAHTWRHLFEKKNIIDDDHLIGPALLTCCVLSTTEKLKHIFSQFLPHTSALFYITPVSLSTAI